MAKAQEVFSSEELVLDKSTQKQGKKSKVLYALGEQRAAMHSQKIGNALRTIDTWYPDFDKVVLPIAIEPYGSVTTKGVAYRHPKRDKSDFYTLFDNWVQLGEIQSEQDQHYVMAMLIRGGVFGDVKD